MAAGEALLEGALARLERDAGPWVRRRLRRDRRLGGRTRRPAAEVAFGALRWKRPLEIALARGGWPAGGAPAHRALWWAALVALEGAPIERAEAALGAPVGVALADVEAAVEGWIQEGGAGPAAALAARASLTEWFAARLLDERGAGAGAAAVALASRAPVTLRANRARIGRDELAARLAAEGVASRPGRWSPDALHVEGYPDLSASSASREGLFEVQDEGSQLIAALIGARPGDRVLDLCAGAGGKSLAIAAAQPQARIYAFDIRRRALAEAARRAARAGVKLRCAAVDERGHPVSGPARAERVLVDAPCSGSGTLRRHPAARWRMTPAVVDPLRAIQAALLARAAGRVAPGGRLVYATCSILRGENQTVVEGFLEGHPGWRLDPAARCLGGADAALFDGPFLALEPGRHGTDGFFAAALRAPSSVTGPKTPA